MAGLAVLEPEGRPQLADLTQGHGAEELERLLHVRGVEERQRGLVLRQLLAIEVVGVLLLQMGGVQEEHFGEVAGGRRAPDPALETLPHEPRDPPDVIEMGVGEDQVSDRAGVERGIGPVAQAEGLHALEHAAVDEHPAAPLSRRYSDPVTVCAAPRKPSLMQAGV